MSWYLIQTKPRQENLAKENLERQGYTTYLPLIPVHRRRRGRTYIEPGAMFPRYLFIRLTEGKDDWRPIRSTLGVANLVHFGQTAASVPDNLITALQSREDSDGVLILPKKIYQPGDRVRIADGPFAGYEAVIQAKSGKQRVTLLLNLIQKHIRICLDTNHLEPLKG